MPLVTQPDYWTCEICGLAVGVVNNDTGADEDTGLPYKWLRIDVSELVRNEDFTEWKLMVDTIVAQALIEAQGSIAPQADGTPQSLTPADKANIRRLTEMQYPCTVPEYVTEEASYCLCPAHRGYLARLDITEYGTEDVPGVPGEDTPDVATPVTAAPTIPSPLAQAATVDLPPPPPDDGA